MGAWVVGSTTGSLLGVYVSYAEAAADYEREARAYADDDDDATWDTLPPDAAEDDYPRMLDTVRAIFRDRDDDDGTGSGERAMSVADGEGRQVTFWLEWDGGTCGIDDGDETVCGLEVGHPGPHDDPDPLRPARLY